MARPNGATDLLPSVERRRGYARELQRAADQGDPTAITGYMLLTHIGALEFETKRKRTDKSGNTQHGPEGHDFLGAITDPRAGSADLR